MEANDKKSWSDMAGAIYGAITSINAEITWTFDHLEVQVPGGSADSAQNRWMVNGQLRIRTQNTDRQGGSGTGSQGQLQ